jgi:hypothetical protein
MADVSGKIAQIMEMIDRGDYFTINRARQYGKTTTLRLLELALPVCGYIPVKISFEGLGETAFESEANFCQILLKKIHYYLEQYEKEEAKDWLLPEIQTNDELDVFLNKVCKDKKYVLMIDETDKSSDNLVFLRFLGMLREKYLKRDEIGNTFHNVILAGVYDIKNLKLKMIQTGQHQLQDGEKRINSPWNIAADFKVDMSLSVSEIESMLNDYENDHKTGMNIAKIAEQIRYYTNGYPFLVSKICKEIDEELNKSWTLNGIKAAVKTILIEKNTLFDDLIKNIRNNDDLRELLYSLVYEGRIFTFNSDNHAQDLGLLFGILKQNDYGNLSVDNKIFELRISNYFISEQELAKNSGDAAILQPELICNGKIDMARLIEKFEQHFYELYSERDAKFLERECRLMFLTYLKPIINGSGFYHIESETRNSQRMDIMVDYGTEQFVIELKLWKGRQAHEKAYSQLSEYLDSKNLKTGYLITFDFSKQAKFNSNWIEYEDKNIFDCNIFSGRKQYLKQ